MKYIKQFYRYLTFIAKFIITKILKKLIQPNFSILFLFFLMITNIFSKFQVINFQLYKIYLF